MGNDIDSGATGTAPVKSVSVSKDGFSMAVTATSEQDGRGATRVFTWDARISEWIQIGQDVVGTNPNDCLGWSIAMNQDGSVIVLGAPNANGDDGLTRVYELDENDSWKLLGDEIRPPTGSQGLAGSTVSINSNGNIVAISSPRVKSYTGCVQVLQLVNGQWVQIGQNIAPESIFSYFGGSIAMTADGNRIVVGSEYGGEFHGSVQVFDYDGFLWQEKQSVNGRYYYDKFGSDVDISEDGNRIIVGSPMSDGNTRTREYFNAGEFCVLEYDGSGWNVIGQKIIGSSSTDQLGQAVAISGDGTHVAISSPMNDDNGSNSGKVEVYKYSEPDNTWILQGKEIHGCAGNNLGGQGAVALDRSGEHLVVGTVKSNGKAQVFEIAAGEGSSDPYNDGDQCP